MTPIRSGRDRSRGACRRLSTRKLATFAGVAAAPAALLAAPTGAQAYYHYYKQNACAAPGKKYTNITYKNPSKYLAGIYAFSNCADVPSSGWIAAGISFWSVNDYTGDPFAILSTDIVLGATWISSPDMTGQYVVHPNCTHWGYAHDHHINCWSSWDWS